MSDSAVWKGLPIKQRSGRDTAPSDRRRRLQVFCESVVLDGEDRVDGWPDEWNAWVDEVVALAAQLKENQ